MKSTVNLYIIIMLFAVTSCSEKGSMTYDYITSGGTIMEPGLRVIQPISASPTILLLQSVDRRCSVIDASEKVVAPGFIDIHTHVDGRILDNRSAHNFVMQGVTTVVGGNCGGSRLELGDFFAKLGGKANLTKENYLMLMRKVGLQEEAFKMRLKNFSKGMRQKLGITITIIKDAPNILLDEPTSVLDSKAAAEFVTILKDLRDDGKSILMCTHDIFRAKAIADHVGIMKEGRLVMVRSRREFLEDDLEKICLD